MLRTSQASRKTRTGAIEISRDSRAKPRFKQTTPSVSCVASTGWASSPTSDTVATDAERVEQLANELRKPEHALVVLWRDARLEMIEWEGSEQTQVPRRVGRWWRGVLGDRNGARLAELEECASQDAALKRDLDELFARTLPHQVETLFAPRDHSAPARRVGVRWVRAAGARHGRARRVERRGRSARESARGRLVPCNFVQRKIGDRLRAAVTEPAVLAALNYLEQQPPRPRRFTDAEQTSRRVIILHRHVESACGGYVPRAHDTAELAGWSEEGAPPEKVRVGAWYRATSSGARSAIASARPSRSRRFWPRSTISSSSRRDLRRFTDAEQTSRTSDHSAPARRVGVRRVRAAGDPTRQSSPGGAKRALGQRKCAWARGTVTSSGARSAIASARPSRSRRFWPRSTISSSSRRDLSVTVARASRSSLPRVKYIHRRHKPKT